jgi:hypothetical protein
MSTPKVYVAGQKACDSCGNLFQESVETWKGHTHLYCDKPACNEAAHNRPKCRYVKADTLKCAAGECDNYVREGSNGRMIKYFVCSAKCWRKRVDETPGRMVTFTCDWCGETKTGRGRHDDGERTFCNRDHAGKHKHEKTLARAGIYRPLFDEYRQTFVLDNYTGGSVRTHELITATFLGFLNEVGISSLNDVTPLTISQYAKWGRDKGSPNLLDEICHIKMFFEWQIGTGMR